MAVHEGVQQAQIGQFRGFVTGHLAEQGFFQMHHFIVRQRQDEVLIEGIHDTEGQLIVMVTAVYWFLLHIEQHIVHPPHVPLETETKSALIGRPGHIWPTG